MTTIASKFLESFDRTSTRELKRRSYGLPRHYVSHPRRFTDPSLDETRSYDSKRKTRARRVQQNLKHSAEFFGPLFGNSIAHGIDESKVINDLAQRLSASLTKMDNLSEEMIPTIIPSLCSSIVDAVSDKISKSALTYVVKVFAALAIFFVTYYILKRGFGFGTLSTIITLILAVLGLTAAYNGYKLMKWINDVFIVANIDGMKFDKSTDTVYSVPSSIVNENYRGPEFHAGEDKSHPLSALLPTILCGALIFFGTAALPDSKGFMNLLNKFKTLPQALRGFADLIKIMKDSWETCTDFVAEHILGQTVAKMDGGLSDAKDLVNRVKELSSKAGLTAINTDPEVCKQVILTHQEILAFRLKEGLCLDALRAINGAQYQSHQLYQAAINSGAAEANIRTKPCFCVIAGKSSIGKSAIVNKLVIDALVSMNIDVADIKSDGTAEQRWGSNVYCRFPEQEFWDGYTQQPIVIFDDAFQRVDSSTNPNDELYEVIRLVNMFNLNLHMANLDQKANTQCRAKFLLATTNSARVDVASLQTPEAVINRIHLGFMAEIDADCSTNGKVDTTKVIKKFGFLSHDYMTFQPWDFGRGCAIPGEHPIRYAALKKLVREQIIVNHALTSQYRDDMKDYAVAAQKELDIMRKNPVVAPKDRLANTKLPFSVEPMSEEEREVIALLKKGKYRQARELQEEIEKDKKYCRGDPDTFEGDKDISEMTNAHYAPTWRESEAMNFTDANKFLNVVFTALFNCEFINEQYGVERKNIIFMLNVLYPRQAFNWLLNIDNRYNITPAEIEEFLWVTFPLCHLTEEQRNMFTKIDVVDFRRRLSIHSQFRAISEVIHDYPMTSIACFNYMLRTKLEQSRFVTPMTDEMKILYNHRYFTKQYMEHITTRHVWNLGFEASLCEFCADTYGKVTVHCDKDQLAKECFALQLTKTEGNITYKMMTRSFNCKCLHAVQMPLRTPPEALWTIFPEQRSAVFKPEAMPPYMNPQMTAEELMINQRGSPPPTYTTDGVERPAPITVDWTDDWPDQLSDDTIEEHISAMLMPRDEIDYTLPIFEQSFEMSDTESIEEPEHHGWFGIPSAFNYIKKSYEDYMAPPPDKYLSAITRWREIEESSFTVIDHLWKKQQPEFLAILDKCQIEHKNIFTTLQAITHSPHKKDFGILLVPIFEHWKVIDPKLHRQANDTMSYIYHSGVPIPDLIVECHRIAKEKSTYRPNIATHPCMLADEEFRNRARESEVTLHDQYWWNRISSSMRAAWQTTYMAIDKFRKEHPYLSALALVGVLISGLALCGAFTGWGRNVVKKLRIARRIPTFKRWFGNSEYSVTEGGQHFGADDLIFVEDPDTLKVAVGYRNGSNLHILTVNEAVIEKYFDYTPAQLGKKIPLDSLARGFTINTEDLVILKECDDFGAEVPFAMWINEKEVKISELRPEIVFQSIDGDEEYFYGGSVSGDSKTSRSTRLQRRTKNAYRGKHSHHADFNSSQISQSLYRQQYALLTTTNTGVTYLAGFATAIRGTVFLTNRHIVKNIERTIRMGLITKDSYIDFKNVNNQEGMRIRAGQILDTVVYPEIDLSNGLTERDYCCFSIGKMNSFKDITSLFATEKDLSQINTTRATICTQNVQITGNTSRVNNYVNRDVTATMEVRDEVAIRQPGGGLKYVNFDDAMEAHPDDRVVIMETWSVVDPHVFMGQCGSPLVLHNTKCQGKIAGILSIADKSGRTPCMYEPITREDIDDLLSKFPTDAKVAHTNDVFSALNINTEMEPKLPEGNFIPIGVAPSPGRATKTTLRPSVLHNQIWPCTQAPASLTPVTIDGERIDPLWNGLKKCGEPSTQLDPKILNEAVRGYENHINFRQYSLWEAQKCNFRRQVLTFEEAIVGVEDDPFIRAIDRSTSPGYPYTLDNKDKGKQAWFGKDQEYDLKSPKVEALRKEVDQAIEQLKRGERMLTVWTDTLKDERKPLIKRHRTRVFSMGNILYLVVARKYFGEFASWMQQNRTINGISVGINPYSSEWHYMAQKLKSLGDNIVAGDFSNFDGTLSSEILSAIADIANRWYDDGPENAQIRRSLLLEICHGIHIVEGNVMQWNKSLPSGNPYTALFNSIYNNIAMRYVFIDQTGLPMKIFDKYIFMVAFGDDNLISIHRNLIEKFNQKVMAEGFKKIGMIYTDEAKSSELISHRSLDEVFYLKRAFRFDEVAGQYVAPLKTETLEQSVQWYRHCPDPSRATADIIENALMEAAYHDKEYFDQYREKIVNFLTNSDDPDVMMVRDQIHIGATYDEYLTRRAFGITPHVF